MPPEVVIGQQPGSENKLPEKDKPAEAAPKKEEPDFKAENERLKTELATKSSEAERAKAYVVNLVQRFQEAATSEGDDDEGDEDRQEKEKKRFKELIEEDPQRALDEHFAKRMGPLEQGRQVRDATLLKEREVAAIKASLGEKGEEKWKKYEAEVEEFMKPISLRAKTTPGAWKEAFQMVRARHFDEELEERLKEREDPERETQMEGGSRAAPSRGRAPLSSLEKTVMKEFGMTEDEWRKYGGGSRNATFTGSEEE